MTGIAHVLARLEEIEKYLVPGANVAKGAGYRQSGLPYWTNGIALSVSAQQGDDRVTLNYTVTMICHLEKLTAGAQMGQLTKETQAQDLLETAVLWLQAHRRLQTPADTTALNEIGNLGLTIQPASISLINPTPNETDYTFGVIIPLLIPLVFQVTDYT